MGPFLALVGSALTLLAALGVVRFPNVLARMHALTKASTVGLVLVLLGGALTLDDTNAITSLILAGALQILTMPVGANLMSRATYGARGIESAVDTVDELAEDLAAAQPAAEDSATDR
ncbi:MAG: monovalent cation/H(+) antiporter subunit G [Acidimicrobiales bacterium]|nr:monovalent cation/H(+) antiporter subunit G [Acidimicrobiales bacterium]